jgi:RHS repeat-associated protein
MDRQRPKDLNDPSYYATFFEEYRYDALGRRILKRARANSPCLSSIYCKSSIERYVWDGNQILLEMRYPGYDNVAPTDLERDTTTLTADGRFYGRVAYTHAGGIDHPVGVVRIGYGDNFNDGLGYAQFSPIAASPYISWEWIIDAVSYESGAAKRCLPPVNSSGHYYRCVQDMWQVRSARARSFGTLPTRPLAWFGGLLQEKKDEGGQLYMRSRYYDPVTGRFTQEDPVGLAGGVNEYGFASGDVVNYDDPFGLCPPARNGAICIDFFIAAASVWGFKGDGRDFDPNAPFSASRAQIVILPQFGAHFYRVSPSCTSSGCNPPRSDNRVTYDEPWGQNKGFDVSFSFTDSKGPLGLAPDLNGTITFLPNADGGYRLADGIVSSYPSMAVYQRVNGQWVLMWQHRESSSWSAPRGLWDPLGMSLLPSMRPQ